MATVFGHGSKHDGGSDSDSDTNTGKRTLGCDGTSGVTVCVSEGGFVDLTETILIGCRFVVLFALLRARFITPPAGAGGVMNDGSSRQSVT